MKKVFRIIFFLIPGSLLLFQTSCTTVDVFEKNAAIPQHAWSSQFKPSFSFEIKDTAARYNVYIVLRHTDAYRYKNIWVNLAIQPPTGDPRSQPLHLELATDEKGWLGSGMDDIFEHRIIINPERPASLKAGTYQYTVSNIMRDDPLNNILNVGIRLEKVK